MHLDDVNDHLDTELDSEDYDSLGGFIIEHLDRLPVAGDEVITEDGIRLIVEKLDKTVSRKCMSTFRKKILKHGIIPNPE